MTSSHQTYSSSKKHHRRSKNNNATSVSTRRLEGGSLPVDMHYSLNDQPYVSEWKNSGKKQRKEKFKETTVIDMGDSCDDERKLMQRSFDSTNVRHSRPSAVCAHSSMFEWIMSEQRRLAVFFHLHHFPVQFLYFCYFIISALLTVVAVVSEWIWFQRRRNCNSHLCCFCFTDFIIYKLFFFIFFMYVRSEAMSSRRMLTLYIFFPSIIFFIPSTLHSRARDSF